MIRINLLPVRVSKRQETARRDLALAGVGAAVVIALCGVLYIVTQAQISDIKTRNNQIQTEITHLQTVEARVMEIDKIKQDLQKKLDVISELRKNKQGPVRMLDELSNATPEKLQMLTLKEEAGSISMTGVAVSNEVISQFLSNLETSEWFDDVYLIEIDQEDKDGLKLKTFSVTARLVVKTEEAEAPPAPTPNPTGAAPAGTPPAAPTDPNATGAAPPAPTPEKQQ